MASFTDLPTYPRTYHIGIWRRLNYLFCAMLVGSAGLIGIGIASKAHGHAFLAWFVLGATGVTSALFLATYAFKYSVTLEADRITVRFFRTRRFRRSDMTGRLTQDVIALRGPPGRGLILSSSLRRDRVFQAWVETLPACNPEREQEAAAVANSTLGPTPEARLQRLKRVRRICNGLSLVAFGLFCICWYYPRPYAVVVAVVAAFPWLALIVGRACGFHKFYGAARLVADPSPFFFILPGLGLIVPSPIGAYTGFHLQGWEHAFFLSLLAGGFLLFVAAKADQRWRRPRFAVALLVGMSAYAYGVLFGANVLLDRSSAQTVQLVVSKKSSKGAGPMVRTEPSPWGDPNDEFRVSASLYDTVSVGDTICVRVHPGALGIEWFALDKCG
jgi:hypothetical protein